VKANENGEEISKKKMKASKIKWNTKVNDWK
jgi:hypothetical protein